MTSTTYSYQTTCRPWLRNMPAYGYVTHDDTQIDHLIAAWTRVRLSGYWLLNRFQVNGEPARLEVTVRLDGHTKWTYELRVHGRVVALFDVSKADKPKHGRIRVRPVNGAPYYMSENDHLPAA